MNLNLEGKHALVCGGSKGIGWASARELALLGATITLVARGEELLRQRVTELPEGSGPHRYLALDFNQLGDVKHAIEGLADSNPVHILVNNSGGPAAGRISDATTDQLITAFGQHVLASQTLAHALIPGMKNAGYGRVINVISTSVKQPIPGLGVSNTIRGAMGNWSKDTCR